MNKTNINRFFNKLPLHLAVIGLMVIWLVPAIGLLVTSLRPVQAINTNGWWMALSAPPGMEAYDQSCGECHGPDGKKLPAADLSDPAVIEKFPRSIQLLAMLSDEIDGQPHMGEVPLPSAQEAADIAAQLKKMAGGESTPRRTSAAWNLSSSPPISPKPIARPRPRTVFSKSSVSTQPATASRARVSTCSSGTSRSMPSWARIKSARGA